jgi:hypothetical protein
LAVIVASRPGPEDGIARLGTGPARRAWPKPGIAGGVAWPAPYHRHVPSLALLAIGLATFVLLLAPTRRLQISGWSPRALGGYLIGMLMLTLSIAYLPISARLLVPILVLGYLAPFVTARPALDRLRGVRRPGVTVERPPIKTVSGPARDLPAEPRATDSEPAADEPAADEPNELRQPGRRPPVE